MDTTLRAALITACVLAAPAARAQEPAAQATPAPVASAQRAGPSFGFGLAASYRAQSGSLGFGGTELWFPIDLGRLRIEPTLALSLERSEGGGLPSHSTSALGVGAGLLYEIVRGERSTIHAGARLAYLDQRSDWLSQDGHRLTAAAVVGGEYFVEPTFSLGAEAQVRYVRQSGDFGSIRDTDTTVLLAARFYLR